MLTFCIRIDHPLTGSKTFVYAARMYTTAELVLLARAYLAHTGMPPSNLGKLAADNDRLFIRLFEGFDCRADTAERASAWFNAHAGEWWPEEVRRDARP